MAVSYIGNHTASSIKTLGTANINVVLVGANVAAGNLLVAPILFDNAGTTLKPVVSSIGRAAGETNNWVSLGRSLSASTSIGAFASAELMCIKTTVPWPAGNYLVTLDTSVTMKATQALEFSGVEPVLRSTSGSAYSTTTTAASATTTGTAPQVGDLALGMLFQSNSASSPSGDTDTTGGSWSNAVAVGSSGGSGTTNNAGIVQYKILTAASHQTYNYPTTLTAGNGSIVAILQATIDPLVTQAAYRMYADGTETGSTALAAQDTAYTADLTSGDANLDIRLRLQETAGGVQAATTDWQLQWNKNLISGTLADSYADTNRSAGVSLANANTKMAQSFTGNGQVLSKAGFYLRRDTGGTTGLITATLWAHSGTFGASGSVPTGVPLAESSTVDLSTLSTSVDAWVYFDFNETFTLVNGTNYFIGMEISGTGSFGATNSYDTTTPTHPGRFALYASGAWASANNYDMMFEVYTGSNWANVVPAVAEHLATSYPETNVAASTVPFPGLPSTATARAQSFLGNGENLTKARFWLKRVDAPDGTVVAVLYAHTGTFGSGGLPTGSPIATSSTVINCASVSTTESWVSFTFDGTTKLANGTAYCIGVLTTNTQATPNVVGIGQDDTAPTAPGSGAVFTTSWASSFSDFAFEVYTGSGTTVVPYASPNLNVPTLADSYPSSERSSASPIGNTGSSNNTFGQTFLGNGLNLTRVGFYMAKVNASPDGTLTAALYAHTGTFGSTGVGTGAPLATSTTVVDPTTLPVAPTYAWVYFDFPAFTLANGTPYVVAVTVTGSSANLTQLGTDTTSSAHPGNSAYIAQSTGLWSAVATWDTIFEVYTATEAATTNRLTGGTGSFVAGKVSTDGLVDDLGWSASNYTELLYAATLKQTDVSNGDALRFRVLRNGATTGLTYTQTPTINVTKAAPAPLPPRNIRITNPMTQRSYIR